MRTLHGTQTVLWPHGRNTTSAWASEQTMHSVSSPLHADDADRSTLLLRVNNNQSYSQWQLRDILNSIWIVISKAQKLGHIYPPSKNSDFRCSNFVPNWPTHFKNGNLQSIFTCSASMVRPSKKSWIITNSHSTTGFSMSPRWTVYVASKSPKGGSKMQGDHFSFE